MGLAGTTVAAYTGVASIFTALNISGIAGFVISQALQNTISNIVWGILSFGDGAIRLGDVIEFGGIKGTVVRTAMRNTWIKREDDKIAIIGNTTLSGGPLINHTATERLNKKIRAK